MGKTEYKDWRDMNAEEIVTEFSRCKEDPIYFIRRYVKVEHQLLGLVPFDLFPFQEKIIGELNDHRFNILHKFRQAGATTIACAYGLWIAVFMENKTIAILSIGDTEAMDILARIRLMWEELPPFLQPELVLGGKNKHNLEFTNRCKIKSKPSKKSSGRSLASYFLIIDEGAFIENIDDIWTSVYPIISTGGRVFVLSTVNGMGGVGKWFHDLYVEAEKGNNNFNPIDIKWPDHPQYYYNPDYEWLYNDLRSKDPGYNPYNFEETTKRNIGLKRWRQEYEGAFLGTGDTFIDPEILANLHENVNEDFMIKYNNRMRVWNDVKPNRDYVMGVDVSLGRERDYSAFHVADCYSGEIVAEFYSNRTPIDEFAQIVAAEGIHYNTALVLVERNAVGSPLITMLFNQLEYENIWMDTEKAGNLKKGRMGWESNQKAREELLTDMEDWVRNKKVLVYSERTVGELFNFVIDENGKIGCDEGMHDDLVMALALTVKALMEYLNQAPMLASMLSDGQEPMSPQVLRAEEQAQDYFKGKSLQELEWVLGK